MRMSEPRSRAQRPRGPGYLLTAAATAGVLLLGVVALSVAQPSPPTVAEFAPSALDQIKAPPSRQGTDVGSGKGGGKTNNKSKPSPTPTVTPTAPEIIQPRVKNCVGDPPRQIEDPQSPPCVNYWQGNNGGATAFGVTANEIRISVPYG